MRWTSASPPALLEDVTVYGEALGRERRASHREKYAVPAAAYPGPTPETRRLSTSLAGTVFLLRARVGRFAALSVTAMTLEARHHQHLWPWVLAVAVGTIGGRREGPRRGDISYTDVAVGAVAGAAVGTLVPLVHRRDDVEVRGLILYAFEPARHLPQSVPVAMGSQPCARRSMAKVRPRRRPSRAVSATWHERAHGCVCDSPHGHSYRNVARRALSAATIVADGHRQHPRPEMLVMRASSVMAVTDSAAKTTDTCPE